MGMLVFCVISTFTNDDRFVYSTVFWPQIWTLAAYVYLCEVQSIDGIYRRQPFSTYLMSLMRMSFTYLVSLYKFC